MQGQPTPGEGEEQHFSWSRGRAVLFPMAVKSHQQKPSSPSTPPQETSGDLDMGIKAPEESSFFVHGPAANPVSLRQQASAIKADPAQGTAPALPPLPPEFACFSQAD